MMGLRQIATILVGAALSASTAGAYYHFYHYTNRSAPYNPIPERFDLTALPNSTVVAFLSDTAAGTISNSSLYPSALSAIRQATVAWSGVSSSGLNVAFGGVVSSGTPQNTPGIDIEFDEMDPLLLGLTATNAAGNQVTTGPTGQFVPIHRPLIRLNQNLSNWSNPSFTEGFFLTVCHEMGHALGLQHTWTSGLMSTDVTRATSLYSPLAADDIAGISFLYPAGNFAQTTGTISGRISFPTGQGIHLASVVAIRPTGAAISALTDADGQFRITGLPVGQYLLYTHPVPPGIVAGDAPGDLWLPLDPTGKPVPAAGPFDTMFYSNGVGTRDYTQATTLNVTPGGSIGGINLTLNARASAAIPAVTTFSYINNVTPVKPGYLDGDGTLVAVGSGLVTNGGGAAPGLNVSFLGGAPGLLPNGGLQAYSGSIAIYLQPFSGTGPRAVVFSLPTDIYVLPAGLNMVETLPPFISSVTPGVESNGSLSLAIGGTMLSPGTEFYLDGVPAPTLRFDGSGRAVVALAPGIAGLHPVISAFNPDGQNSMFLQSGAPMTFTYGSGGPGPVSFTPNVLQAGTTTTVEIDGTAGDFVDGMTMFGVGSSDVLVQQVTVVSPNKMLAVVSVAPTAAAASGEGTVATGFRVISQPGAFQILGTNAKASAILGILNVLGPNNTAISSSQPARPGNVLGVVVQGLASAGAAPDPKQVQVSIAGLQCAALAVTPQGNAHLVQVVAPSAGTGQVPLTVSTAGHTTPPYFIPVMN
jgi:hypothetical protein